MLVGNLLTELLSFGFSAEGALAFALHRYHGNIELAENALQRHDPLRTDAAVVYLRSLLQVATPQQVEEVANAMIIAWQDSIYSSGSFTAEGKLQSLLMGMSPLPLPEGVHCSEFIPPINDILSVPRWWEFVQQGKNASENPNHAPNHDPNQAPDRSPSRISNETSNHTE